MQTINFVILILKVERDADSWYNAILLVPRVLKTSVLFII